MKLRSTPLSGLIIVETAPIPDERGSFERLFCRGELTELHPDLHWSQINLSRTRRQGTIRGMHFQQPPFAEAKLIRCLRGRVFDVAVDLREGSPTFLHWHAVELVEDEAQQVYIPEGFAHGFQTLTQDVELLYMHTMPWSREHEGRLRYDDPQLAIDWPLPAAQVSDKDGTAPLLDSRFEGIRL